MININDNWKFTKLPDINSIQDINHISEQEFEKLSFDNIKLPHTWYEDGNLYDGCAVYIKKCLINTDSDKRIFINFEGVERWCRVFVNNELVGEHKGGYSAFTFDITEQCMAGVENTITVLVDNRSWNIISPLAGDFTVFGGIYRNVSIIETKKDCFDRTFYGTDGVIVNTDMSGNDGVVNVTSYITSDKLDDVVIRYVLKDNSNNIVLSEIIEPGKMITDKNVNDLEKSGAYKLNNRFIIDTPHLWNGLDNPEMYSFEAELIKNDKIIDYVHKLVGFKKVSIDAKNGFYLNGKNIKIKGVAKHQDYAGVFNATDSSHWEMDMSDLLDIGANSVRLSHYQHPQGMYNLCDENGMIVWAEIPFLKINESEEFFENTCSQLKELILQNIHHPSICFWGVQNEIAMFAENETTYKYVEKLNEFVKKLDRTRISAGANLFCVKNDSRLNKLTDAIGYNIYFGWYYGEMKDNEDFVEKFHRDNPQIPLGITEYGVDCNLQFHNDNPKVRDYSEDFQALYHETVYPIFASKSYIWGTYVWNMYDFSSGIRDEGGVKYKNCKGLVTYDRKIKKDAYYYYKAQWSEDKFVKIAQERYINHMEGITTVKVYSNTNCVSIAVKNGNELQRYSLTSDNGVFLFKNVKIGHGINIVEAYSNELMDTVTFMGCDKPDNSYIYVDKDPGVNVKNWFIDAVEEEKLFPTGKYSIRESCLELLKSKEAMEVIKNFNEKLAQQIEERQSPMPLERVLNYMKNEISEKDCKILNQKLIKITKE